MLWLIINEELSDQKSVVNEMFARKSCSRLTRSELQCIPDRWTIAPIPLIIFDSLGY